MENGNCINIEFCSLIVERSMSKARVLLANVKCTTSTGQRFSRGIMAPGIQANTIKTLVS